MPRELAYIGLGSNLGDRYSNLRGALEALREEGSVCLTAVSAVYETEAHTRGPEDTTRPFLNAAAAMESSLEPHELLDRLQEIESQFGRRTSSSSVWQARTLDLDLLLFGERICSSKRLTLPHPRMGDRRFVLRPLVDINPSAWVPSPFAATVEDLLDRCEDAAAIRQVDTELASLLDGGCGHSGR